jgi:hypothetical protein
MRTTLSPVDAEPTPKKLTMGRVFRDVGGLFLVDWSIKLLLLPFILGGIAWHYWGWKSAAAVLAVGLVIEVVIFVLMDRSRRRPGAGQSPTQRTGISTTTPPS